MSEQTMQPAGFWRRNGWVVALAVLLVAAITATVWASVSQQTQLRAQETTIEGLEDELDRIEQADAEKVDTDAFEALGVNRARVAEDTDIITALLSTAFTWDSGLGYETARQDVKERYELSEDGAFLSDFMPPSRYNEDAEGQRYYFIDAEGLNSSLGDDPEVEVISVRADSYRYAVVATASMSVDAVEQNQAAPAQVQAGRKMLLFVTIDGEGAITELSGVPASGSVRSSD